MLFGGRTLIIDDVSPPGAWATAIAHTPHLNSAIAGGRFPAVREGEAGLAPPVSGPASPTLPETRG